MRLCEAAFGTMLTYDGERFQAAAFKRAPERYAEFMKQGPFVFAPETGPGRLLAGEPFVRIDDATSEKAYTSGDEVQRALVDLAGARSLATVPLRKVQHRGLCRVQSIFALGCAAHIMVRMRDLVAAAMAPA